MSTDDPPAGGSCARGRKIAEERRTEHVRALNDAFRQSLSGGRVLLTRRVAALGEVPQRQILEQVQRFDRFTPENDPYGEHDFGIFEAGETRVLWKIDYYDLLFIGASPDPADPSVTARVLTVMLADEY